MKNNIWIILRVKFRDKNQPKSRDLNWNEIIWFDFNFVYQYKIFIFYFNLNK